MAVYLLMGMLKQREDECYDYVLSSTGPLSSQVRGAGSLSPVMPTAKGVAHKLLICQRREGLQKVPALASREVHVMPEEELIAAQVLPDEQVGEVGGQALQQPVIRGRPRPQPDAHPLLRQSPDQRQHGVHCLQMITQLS